MISLHLTMMTETFLVILTLAAIAYGIYKDTKPPE